MAPTMRWRSVRAQRSVGFGVRAGRLLSLEIGNTGVPTCCGSAEGNIGGGVMREPSADPAGSESLCMESAGQPAWRKEWKSPTSKTQQVTVALTMRWRPVRAQRSVGLGCTRAGIWSLEMVLVRDADALMHDGRQ